MSTLLELTWRGALMLVVVASLDRLCAARINARVRRAWWLLVPLAFLVTVPLPILPTLKSSALGSTPAHGTVSWFVNMAMHPNGRSTAVEPSPIITASWWLVITQWALFITLVGSAVYLLTVLGRTCSALRRWSQLPVCLDSRLLLALAECRAEAGITASIGLAVSERVSMPLLLGWRHPRILLPSTLATSLSREQLRGVLFHELAHLRALDVPCTFLFTLVCALHWFNPAAHIALRRWAQFREEAADEAAILWLGQTSGVNYGETLLLVLRHTHEQPVGPFLTLSIVESIGQLRTRLLMIKHYERRSPHPLFTGTVFAAAALSILLRPVRAQDAPIQTASQPAATSEQGAHTLSPSQAYPSARVEVVDSPACKDFVARLVSAINSRDQEKITALLHPKCLPWLSEKENPANSPQRRLEYYASYTIPEQRNVFATTIAPDAGLPWSNGVIWPVRPTNQVGIDFKDASGQKTGVIVFVAADGDKWYEVVSIPRP